MNIIKTNDMDGVTSIIAAISDIYENGLLPHKPDDVMFFVHATPAICAAMGWDETTRVTKYYLPILVDPYIDTIPGMDGSQSSSIYLWGYYNDDL